MRRFCITVNGKSFDVEVEEIRGGAAPAARPAAPAPRTVNPAPVSAPAAKPVPAPAPAAAASAGPAMSGEVVATPLPGSVLRVLKKQGDAVKAGDVIVVVEAMKMENEIVSPRDGVIADMRATQGMSVQTGDSLFSLS